MQLLLQKDLAAAGIAIDSAPPQGVFTTQGAFINYQSSAGPTDFKEFEGRDHFIIGEKGWEEVADYCRAWLKEKDV